MQTPGSRWSGRLAWSLWVITVLVNLGAIILLWLASRNTALSRETLLDASLGLILTPVALVGTRVVARTHRQPVGWLLLIWAFLISIATMGEAYGMGLLYGGLDLPAGLIVAWVSSWLPLLVFLSVPALLLLVFPTGKLSGPRWVWVAALIVAAAITTTITNALSPVLDEAPFQGISNPVFAGGDLDTDSIGGFGWAGMAVGLVFAGVSMVRRLRRSRGLEREQLKWMALGAALIPTIIASSVASYFLGREDIGDVLFYFGVLPIPLTAAYAIQRHRLFNVDHVLRRAMTYSVVTIALAAVYFGITLLVGLGLNRWTGRSDFTVALATLAVATLFRPVRERIQSAVDRRFFRRGYDTQQTLEDFASRLRTGIDIQRVQSELASTIRSTVQPVAISLWVRR